MPSHHLILCRPLLFLPSIFPGIRVFSSELALPIRWPKYWSFSFSINLSNEYSWLISFRSDWCDLLAVQGTLQSLLQHHNTKASVLHHSTFFMVQISHPYMTTGKSIALTIQIFVGKVMSLLLTTLSKFVIAFLPRSKCLRVFVVCSVAQSCLTLCDPVDCSTPGFPVLHHLLELAQTHFHWVGDAIQPSHRLSSPSPRAFNLSQPLGIFQWLSSLHQVAKVLGFQLQHKSLMNIQGWFPLGWTGWVSLQSKGLSRVFSNTTVQKHQFFSALYSPTLTSIPHYWKNHSFD